MYIPALLLCALEMAAMLAMKAATAVEEVIERMMTRRFAVMVWEMSWK